MIRNNVHTFRLNGLNDGYLKMRMEWNFVIVKNYLVWWVFNDKYQTRTDWPSQIF